MKKVISLLLTAMLLLSMLPATMAEGVEYIPAPYALDAERAGPKAYVEPVFYANGEGEPTIGVTYVGVIKADGKYSTSRTRTTTTSWIPLRTGVWIPKPAQPIWLPR